MKAQYIIYTAGKMAVNIKNYALDLGLEIIGFYDNNIGIQGKLVDGLKIFSTDELFHCVEENLIDGFIIGTKVYEKEVIEEIANRFKNKVRVIKSDEVQKKYWDNIAVPMRENLDERYYVCYSKQIEIWIYNLMSEVEYWIDVCKNKKEVNQIRYSMIHKEFHCERLHKKIELDSIVIDAGCGICSKYGKKGVKLISLDPLAYFYNVINNKLHMTDNEIIFGLFEFVSSYFESDYADIILIDNALDHCIDPFRSIIECLTILKKDGILSMRHRRGEAVYEGYTGLHKWNIDVDNSGCFIIWNKNNKINISKILSEIVQIEVFFKDNVGRERDYLDINIIKKRDFKKEDFFDIKEESKLLSEVVNKMMKYFAEERYNLYFKNLLMEL